MTDKQKADLVQWMQGLPDYAHGRVREMGKALETLYEITGHEDIGRFAKVCYQTKGRNGEHIIGLYSRLQLPD
jgi:hypothetical protein